MNLSEIIDMVVREGKKYGVDTTGEEVKDLIRSSLRDIHIDVGGPIQVWVSTTSKSADENPVEFPSDDDGRCVEVKDVYLDNVKLYKHHLNKLTEINNEETST